MIHTCVYLLHVFLKSGTCVGLLFSKLFSKNTIFLRLGQAGAVFLASALRNAVPLHTSALRHSRMRSVEMLPSAGGSAQPVPLGAAHEWIGVVRNSEWETVEAMIVNATREAPALPPDLKVGQRSPLRAWRWVMTSVREGA